MTAKLLENTPGSPVSAGFGGTPGFGFAWGCDSPLHTWYMWPADFLQVGKSFSSFGCYSRAINSSAITAALWLAALDYINQDQHTWGVSDTYYSTFMESAGLYASPGDGVIAGTTTYPVPFLLGGNACESFVGIFVTGAEYPAGQGIVTAGVQAIRGVGFEPDLVIFLGGDSNGATGDSGRMMVGMMDAAGNQWVCSESGIFGSAGFIIGGAYPGYPARLSEFRTDACTLILLDPVGSPGGATSGRNRASFNSMDPDGFNLNIDEYNPPSGGHIFVALKVNDPTKAFFQVGTLVQGDGGVSGMPLPPDGVVLCGDSWSTAIDGVTPSVVDPSAFSTRAYISIGGFDATTQRSSVSGCSSHEGANPLGYYDDSAIVFGNDSAITGRALGGLTADGFTLGWTDDDGGARPFGYLAFQVPNNGLPAFNARIPAERT